MNKNKITMGISVITCLVIISFWYLIIKEIRDFKIDHKCYLMSDAEFYLEKMCRPYWRYRR